MMSPKVFSVTITSNCSGSMTNLHPCLVDEHVLELDIRVLAADLGGHPPPQPRGVEHVRFVHRAGPAPRSRASLHALLTIRAIWSGWYSIVEDGPVLADAPGAEVEAPDELADDEQVDFPASSGRRFA